MLSNLKDNRFICVWTIYNGLFAALLTVATLLGWVTQTLNGDKTYFSHGIVALFFVGWGFCLHRALWVNWANKNIDQVQALYTSYLSSARTHEDGREAFQTLLSGKIDVLEYFSRLLVCLGLVGTVVGIIVSMRDINADMIGNLQIAGQAVANMLHGLGVVFTTTLVGSASMVWIQFQEKLISGELMNLYRRVLSDSEKSL